MRSPREDRRHAALRVERIRKRRDAILSRIKNGERKRIATQVVQELILSSKNPKHGNLQIDDFVHSLTPFIAVDLSQEMDYERLRIQERRDQNVARPVQVESQEQPSIIELPNDDSSEDEDATPLINLMVDSDDDVFSATNEEVDEINEAMIEEHAAELVEYNMRRDESNA